MEWEFKIPYTSQHSIKIIRQH